MTTPLPEQPVGKDIGLDPLRPELHIQIVPPTGSRDVLTNPNDYRTGSEFGGVAGMVQPVPHVPTASERLRQVYAISPDDDGTRPDSVLPPELEGDFRPR
jgi:hypothetical protein